MKHYIFDLLKMSRAQVRTFLNNKAREELTGGIYLWVNQNNGHFYVGSTLNFYNRITSYFTLKGAYGIILSALTKYGYESIPFSPLKYLLLVKTGFYWISMISKIHCKRQCTLLLLFYPS